MTTNDAASALIAALRGRTVAPAALLALTPDDLTALTDKSGAPDPEKINTWVANHTGANRSVGARPTTAPRVSTAGARGAAAARKRFGDPK